MDANYCVGPPQRLLWCCHLLISLLLEKRCKAKIHGERTCTHARACGDRNKTPAAWIMAEAKPKESNQSAKADCAHTKADSVNEIACCREHNLLPL